jgi:hypothetical protein
VADVRGQEAFTFTWTVEDVAGTGSSNSNGFVEPGEDAMIYLNASFRPGVGGTAVWNSGGGTGQLGQICGLGEVIFSLIGKSNIASGVWISDSPVPGFALSPIGGVQPGTNNLVGMIFGQYPPPGLTPDPRNDDWFYRARWRPTNYISREVAFRFQNEAGIAGDPSVMLDVGHRDPQGAVIYRRDTWTFDEPSGSFLVVPGSPSWLVLGASLWVLRGMRI